MRMRPRHRPRWPRGAEVVRAYHILRLLYKRRSMRLSLLDPLFASTEALPGTPFRNTANVQLGRPAAEGVQGPSELIIPFAVSFYLSIIWCSISSNCHCLSTRRLSFMVSS